MLRSRTSMLFSFTMSIDLINIVYAHAIAIVFKYSLCFGEKSNFITFRLIVELKRLVSNCNVYLSQRQTNSYGVTLKFSALSRMQCRSENYEWYGPLLGVNGSISALTVSEETVRCRKFRVLRHPEVAQREAEVAPRCHNNYNNYIAVHMSVSQFPHPPQSVVFLDARRPVFEAASGLFCPEIFKNRLLPLVLTYFGLNALRVGITFVNCRKKLRCFSADHCRIWQ